VPGARLINEQVTASDELFSDHFRSWRGEIIYTVESSILRHFHPSTAEAEQLPFPSCAFLFVSFLFANLLPAFGHFIINL
jgi:hypothetical protein